MKIMIAGAFQYAIYEPAMAKALVQLGHKVVEFAWSGYFHGEMGRWEQSLGIMGIQSRQMNLALLNTCQRHRPDVVWIWRGTNVSARVLRAIKQETGTKLVSYNNDDPFAWKSVRHVPWQHHFLWRHFLRTISCYDINFVYRRHNLEDYQQAGSHQTELLMSWYVPWLHHPLPLSSEEPRYDAIFVGHAEDDGRIESLGALVNAGIDVRLIGDKSWSRSRLRRIHPQFVCQPAVRGEDYVRALIRARICLCFLSKWNRDTYTRRCFEIPACGGFLMSERSEYLQQLFYEDHEAVFFSTPDELVRKARYYLAHPEEMFQIAEAGRQRVLANGHDVVSRMAWFIGRLRTEMDFSEK